MVGQLDSPAFLFAGIHFEKSAAVKTTSKTIFNTPDSEFPIPGAHDRSTEPWFAVNRINRVDIIKTACQRTLEQGFASRRVQIPPSFGDPPLRVPIAQGYGDGVLGQITGPEIGFRWTNHQYGGKRRETRDEQTTITLWDLAFRVH